MNKEKHIPKYALKTFSSPLIQGSQCHKPVTDMGYVSPSTWELTKDSLECGVGGLSSYVLLSLVE